MAWETVEMRIPARRKNEPVTVSLVQMKDDDRLRMTVTIAEALVADLGLKARDQFSLSIGTGEHAGRIRIIKNGEPAIVRVAIGRFGVARLRFGIVPAMGDEPMRMRCSASKIDDETIEIVLPAASGASSPKPVTQPRVVSAPTHKTPASQPRSTPEKASVGKAAVHAANGVSIVTTPNNESISYRGKSMEITALQAWLFQGLLVAMPSPVDYGFLKRKLYGAGVNFDMVVRDAKSAAKSIGLEVRDIKGVGIALVAS